MKVYCSHQREGCEWIGELGQLDRHLNTDPEPTRTRRQEQKLPRQDIAEYLKNNLITHISLPTTSYTRQQDEITSHSKQVTSLQTENRQLKAKISTLELKLVPVPSSSSVPSDTSIPTKGQDENLAASFDTENKKLRPKITQLKTPIKTKHLFESSLLKEDFPIFTMTNYQQHKRFKHNCWYSPPVYTHPQGYKFCLRVVVYGQGYGKGTQISVIKDSCVYYMICPISLI